VTRRAVGAVIAAIGGLLLVALVAMSGFAMAADGDAVVTDAVPVATGAGLDRLRAGIQLIDRTRPEVSAAVPALAEQLGTDTAGLRAAYPAVGDAVDRLPEYRAFADRIVRNLEVHEADTRDASELELPGASLAALPWMGAALALAFIALGIWAWLNGRMPLVVALVLGGLTAVLPLATGAPARAASAERALDSLNPDAAVTRAMRADQRALAAGVAELRDRLLPDVASRTGTSVAAVRRDVASSWPSLGRIVEGFEDEFAEFERANSFREEHGSRLRELKGAPVRVSVRGFTLAGVAVAVVALLGLVVTRR
jgi:hypothetical protein